MNKTFDACPSCGELWVDHAGVAYICSKWQSDKYLLRGALRIIREAGLKVGSKELLEAAEKEDGR